MSEGTESQQESTAPELSPVEQKALEMGWRPKEEFEGAEEDFIDAKEFVSRQPLFDKISQQNKQIKRTQEALEALKTHYTKVKESEYQRALKDLKEQKKQALIDGDVDKFYSIEEAQESIEAEKQEFVQSQQEIEVEAPRIHPELQSWINRNAWYENQPHMRVFADQQGKRLQGTMSPAEVLREVEKLVRAEFPNKFRNPNKDKPSAVEGSSRKTSSNGGDFELTDQERRIMNNLVQSKTLTKEQYIADLKAAKGLK